MHAEWFSRSRTSGLYGKTLTAIPLLLSALISIKKQKFPKDSKVQV
jgi:hypothetical protein